MTRSKFQLRLNPDSEAHKPLILPDPSNARARAVGIRNPDADESWPYGPNIDRTSRALMVNWAERNGLRLSRTGRTPQWLRTGRELIGYMEDHPYWYDHVTGWTYQGKPAVLVAQPYGLFSADMIDLAKIVDPDQTPALSVRIGPTGWYGHGTTMVEIWRKDIEDTIRERRVADWRAARQEK